MGDVSLVRGPSDWALLFPVRGGLSQKPWEVGPGGELPTYCPEMSVPTAGMDVSNGSF